MTKVAGSIITDCADGLARSRQQLRFESLFGVSPAFLGVSSYEPLEAAGSLLDQLDIFNNFPAGDKQPSSVVLVNVAPRGEDVREKWDNGVPFCHFRTGNALVVSTFTERVLALAHRFGVVNEVELMDIPTVTQAAVSWGGLTSAQADKINHSQFRSLEFLPLAAYWLSSGRAVPSKVRSLQDLPDTQNLVWHTDSFGNAKTTLAPEDIGFEPGKQVRLSSGREAVCHARLADVPKGVTALTVGSSGYGDKRFIEVAIGHRGRAADEHNLSVGSAVVAEGITR